MRFVVQQPKAVQPDVQPSSSVSSEIGVHKDFRQIAYSYFRQIRRLELSAGVRVRRRRVYSLGVDKVCVIGAAAIWRLLPAPRSRRDDWQHAGRSPASRAASWALAMQPAGCTTDCAAPEGDVQRCCGLVVQLAASFAIRILLVGKNGTAIL